MEHPLHALCPLPLHLVWHENSTSYLSVRKGRRSLSLRAHRLFYDAPTPVLQALIQYALHRDPRARAVIRQMAHLHFSQTSAPAKPLQSIGKIYNLQEILERMQNILPVPNLSIGWSNRTPRGALRSMTFGTYDGHRRQIRIHPLLDDPAVPLYFLEFIVYHEMVHAICPTKMGTNGKCKIHTKEFRDQERQFPQFKAAHAWGKTSLLFFKKRKSDGRA